MISFDQFIETKNEEDIDLSPDELGEHYFDNNFAKSDWPFQNRAVERVWAAIDNGYRHPLLVSPTGSGKTRMSGMIASEAVRNRGMRVAFTADRLILLEQARKTFEAQGFRCGMIIADHPTDSKAEIQIISKDTFVSRYLDHLGKLKMNSHVGDFDMIINDEAHRWTNGSHLQIREQFPNAHVVGLTATPILPSGKPLGVPYFDTMIEAARPSELLAGGYILPAIVWAPDRPDLKNAMGKGKNSDYNKAKALAEMKRDNIVGSSIKNWKTLAEDRQTLVFCVDRKHAKWNALNYTKNGIPSLYVGCEMSMGERKSIFARFENGSIKCLHSSDLLTEGVDFPWVECLQILKPTRSLRLHLQIIGRGMRKHTFPDGRVKENFIVIDHAGACLAHCLPGEDIPWNLGTQRIEEIIKKEKEIGNAPKNIACPQCYLIHPANRSACPNCGYVYRENVNAEKMSNKDGKLVKIADTIPQDASPDEVKAFVEKRRKVEWIKAIRTAAKRNTTWGAAAAQFKNQCGVLPWDCGMSPLPPSNDWKKKVNETPNLIP